MLSARYDDLATWRDEAAPTWTDLLLRIDILHVCGVLIVLLPEGATATAPLEMDGVVGTWRAASRVRGSRAGAAAATSARAYVLGGTTDGIELTAGVWSTGRL
jgi:hypothetical protein